MVGCALSCGLFDAVYMASDAADVLREAKAIGARPLLLPRPAEREGGVWLGGVAAAQAALDDFGAEADVMSLDAACPFVDETVMRRAADRLAAVSAPVVISMTMAEDHPCQQFVYLRIVSSGMFVPVDAAMRPWRGRAMSAAFPFDWTGVGARGAKPGSFWGVLAGRLGWALAPLGAEEAPDTVFVCEEAGLARAVAAEDGGDAAMLSFDPCRPGVCLRAVPGDAGRVRMDIPGGEEGEASFLYLAASQHDGRSVAAFARRDRFGGFQVGADFASVGRPVAYYALAPWRNRMGDEPIHFSYEAPRLWGYDAEGLTVNLATGMRINGRQDFPEVYVPVGGVCVVRAGHAHALQGEGLAIMAGVTLSPREATRIDGLPGLLAARVLAHADSHTSCTAVPMDCRAERV